MNRKFGIVLFLALCSMMLLSSCGETSNAVVDSPPAEDIEEKMPEESAEEADTLVSEEPPAKQGTDWSVYEPLYIGTIPVGCIMVPDATPENVSDCVKSVLQTDQNFYARDYGSKYIASKMVIEELLDIYGCTGTAIFNFDWSGTLSDIVFKFDDGGAFTPELFNMLHNDICTTLGVDECFGAEYGLHKEAQNGHTYQCSWLGDDLDFECSLNCYFDDSGKPDGGIIKFERTVRYTSSNSSIQTLSKNDSISQDGLTAEGTYHDVSNPYVEGTITNNSDATVKFVEVKVTFYNDGKVTDTDWTYAVGAEGLEPGESSQWKIYCSDAEAIKISFME